MKQIADGCLQSCPGPGRHGEDQVSDPHEAETTEMDKEIKEGMVADNNNCNSATKITNQTVVTTDSMITLGEEKICRGTITVIVLTGMGAVSKEATYLWCALYVGKLCVSRDSQDSVESVEFFYVNG